MTRRWRVKLGCPTCQTEAYTPLISTPEEEREEIRNVKGIHSWCDAPVVVSRDVEPQ